MTFAHPIVLAAVPFAAALWWTVRRAHRAGDAGFPGIRRLWADARGLSERRAARRRGLRGACLGLGAAAALLALARPQWGEVAEQRVEQSREVVLALDLSRSMLADDVSPSRLARAKLLIGALLDQLRGERVGLVVFAGTAFTQSPLSADYEVLRELLDELDPTYLPQGGTDYAAMLETAARAFGEQGGGDRFLIVLSDGEAHDEAWRAQLPALRTRGVTVIGLGVGTPAGALVPAADGGALKDRQGNAVLSRLEPATLQALADATNGVYRDAATWVDLAALVDETVARGRAGNYVEERGVRLQDRFQWFLAPALALLLLGLWLELPAPPLARARHLRRRPALSAPTSAIAAAALLAGLTPSPVRAAVADAPPLPSAAAATPPTLASTVAELSARAALGAPDYARLAQDTIGFAAPPTAPTGPIRDGVIDDALAAVDRGERLDAAAADWPALRAELERLRAVAAPPPPQEQPQDSPQQDEQQSTGDGDAADQPHSAGTDGAGDQQQESDGGAESRDGAEAGGRRHGSDGDAAAEPDAAREEQSATSGDDPEPQQAAAAAETKEIEPDDGVRPLDAAEASLGDGDASSETDVTDPRRAAAQDAAHEPAAPPAHRMVGGGQALPNVDPQGDPALAEALARMEHVRDGDAPAVLFDRMNRAEGRSRPQPHIKDW